MLNSYSLLAPPQLAIPTAGRHLLAAPNAYIQMLIENRKLKINRISNLKNILPAQTGTLSGNLRY